MDKRKKNFADSEENETFKIESLAHLKKQTIGETYKFLNELLKKKQLSKENFLILISTTTDLSNFDESLRLIIINSLRLKDQAMTLLFSQNNHMIRKILNFSWFLNDAMSVDEVCTNIIPCVSAKARNILYNKLSKNAIREEEAEKLFKFLMENYGRAQAELFLPKCSFEFINNYFSNEKPLFQNQRGSKILLNISRRFPQLVIDLYDILFKEESMNGFQIINHEQVLVYLAQHHLDIFIPFFQQNYYRMLFLKFGGKLSRKLGPKVKQALFKKKDLHKSHIFKKSALLSSFSFDDQVEYMASMVKFEHEKLSFLNWIDSTYSLRNLLNYINPSDRLNLIESVFQQVYNINFWDHIFVCHPEIFEVIPLKSRVSCVEAYKLRIQTYSVGDHQRTDFGDGLDFWNPLDNPDAYMYLYSFKTAFPALKEELLRAPSLIIRQDILHSMVKNCAINNDAENLKKLVDYVADRFRNDSPSVFVEFIDEIFHRFPLKSLTFDTVEKLEEMLQLCFMKNERQNYCYLLEKCMLNRLMNNMTVDNQVKQIIDWSVSDKRFRQVFIYDYSFQESRKLFFKFYEKIMERMDSELANDDTNSESLTLWILITLKEFNRFHKGELIDLSQLSGLLPRIAAFEKKNSKGILEDVPLEAYLQYTRSVLAVKESPLRLMRLILKRTPRILVDKLHPLLAYLLSTYREKDSRNFFFRCAVKMFSFVNVEEKVRQFLTSEFHHGNSADVRKNALTMLSHLCGLEEFERVIAKYRPCEDRVEVDVELSDGIHLAEIQLLVPEVIKNLSPPWKNIDFIFEFFKGDFFPRVLTSFYACCLSTRVDHLMPVLLNRLRNLPKFSKVSIKKELIRIILRVCDRREAMRICQECWDSFDHYSIRTILFRHVSTVFSEQPAGDLFHVIEKFVGESDDIVIEERPKLNMFPPEFFAAYVLCLWNFSEKHKPKVKNGIRQDIVNNVNMSTIGLLSVDFCQELIRSSLFRNNLDVKNFAAYYLIMESEAVAAKVDFVIELLKTSQADSQSFSNYLKVLRRITMENSDSASIPAALECILNKWPYADKVVLYDDRLILYYYYLYHKIFNALSNLTSEEKSERFGTELRTFYCSHSNLSYLAPIFMDTLKIFVNELTSHNKTLNFLTAFKHLLFNREETGLAILVISLLAHDHVKLYKAEDKMLDSDATNRKKILKEIVQMLKDFPDEVVSLYFTRKFGLRLK